MICLCFFLCCLQTMQLCMSLQNNHMMVNATEINRTDVRDLHTSTFRVTILGSIHTHVIPLYVRMVKSV